MPTPSPSPFPPSHTPSFPALYLFPLNDSFVPKHISLVNGQRVKIGRQTNAKTVPGERNGYFDSKVLSRQHAEVWEDNGKIYIKDVKSSNGTFINGERLSQEGVESDPFELKTDDIVEFGIDIVGEDNKTIIHHKVAARVYCIFSSEDLMAATRDSYNYQQQNHQTAGPPGTINGAAQRRPTIQNNVTMGGMGGGMRPPGKSGLTFEVILARLNGQLMQSRETVVELNAVSNSLNEIGEVISGGQPANLPPYPHVLPPVRPPSQNPAQQQPPSQQQQQPPQTEQRDSSSVALAQLQTQLAETQASLSTHVEKFRTLETLLNEHDGLRRELHALREMIEERDRQRMNEHHHLRDEDDDSDTQSIRTLGPHELESVPEEDEGEEEQVDERHERREEFVRPRTPEPSSLGMHDDDDDHERSNSRDLHEAEHRLRPISPPPIPEEMERRLGVLSEQLESVFEISRSLQAQHTAAQQTIEALETKISALEEMVRETQAAKAAEEAKLAEAAVQREKAQQDSMTAMLAEFKKSFEDRLDSFKSEWVMERERMDKAKSEWDGRIKNLEEGVSSVSGKFELGLSTISTQLAALQNSNRLALRVKDARHKGGLVTPPSPRSSSAESDNESTRLRSSTTGATTGRKRSTSRSRRGRSKTKSRSPATSTSATLVDGGSVNGGTGTNSAASSLHSRSSSGSPPPAHARDTNGHAHTDVDSIATSPENGVFPPSQFPLTPESSLLHLKGKTGDVASTTTSSSSSAPVAQSTQAVNNAQVAVGVFIFGVAAAAVLWRVKEGKVGVVA